MPEALALCNTYCMNLNHDDYEMSWTYSISELPQSRLQVVMVTAFFTEKTEIER